MNKFWAPINSGDTANVDFGAPRVILLPGIFGAYVMEEPRMVKKLFTFTISQSGGIAGAQTNALYRYKISVCDRTSADQQC